MLHGDPTGRDANVLKAAVHGALDEEGDDRKENSTPRVDSDGAPVRDDASPHRLQNKVDGVYAAKRRGRERAVLAMKQAHLKTLPPVTGDDAQLSACSDHRGRSVHDVYRPVRQKPRRRPSSL